MEEGRREGGREGSRENIAQLKQSKNDRGVETWRWEEDAESSHPEPQIGSREQTLEVEGVFYAQCLSVFSDVLPGRLHLLNLPIQCRLLGTKCSMLKIIGDIFSFKLLLGDIRKGCYLG